MGRTAARSLLDDMLSSFISPSTSWTSCIATCSRNPTVSNELPALFCNGLPIMAERGQVDSIELQKSLEPMPTEHGKLCLPGAFDLCQAEVEPKVLTQTSEMYAQLLLDLIAMDGDRGNTSDLKCAVESDSLLLSHLVIDQPSQLVVPFQPEFHLPADAQFALLGAGALQRHTYSEYHFLHRASMDLVPSMYHSLSEAVSLIPGAAAVCCTSSPPAASTRPSMQPALQVVCDLIGAALEAVNNNQILSADHAALDVENDTQPATLVKLEKMRDGSEADASAPSSPSAQWRTCIRPAEQRARLYLHYFHILLKLMSSVPEENSVCMCRMRFTLLY